MFRSANDVVVNILKKETFNDEEENQRLQCKFCTKNDFSETELLLHQNVKHRKNITVLTNENPFFCRICLKDCENSQNFLDHFKVEHLFTSADSFRVQREIFICDYCGNVFFNKKILQIHFLVSHIKIIKKHVPLTCLICGKHLYSKTIFYHLQKHDIQNVGMCPICFVKCKTKKLLLDHIKTHSRYLRCEMCMYETKREDFFRQHIIDRHKTNITYKNNKEYDYCFTQEQSEQKWRHRNFGPHEIMLTNDVRICILCREICVGKSNMEQHISVEHNWKVALVKPKHLCTCGEIFTNKVLLKHHTFKMKGDHKMLE